MMSRFSNRLAAFNIAAGIVLLPNYGTVIGLSVATKNNAAQTINIADSEQLRATAEANRTTANTTLVLGSLGFGAGLVALVAGTTGLRSRRVDQ